MLNKYLPQLLPLKDPAMLPRHAVLSAIALQIGLLAGVSSVPAQGINEPEREGVRLVGTLKGLRPGLMQIEAEDGEVWLVKLEARPDEVTFTGTALPDWLRRGMWVRFRANLDQRAQADGPVRELTVFTPRDGLPLGVMPDTNLAEGLFSGPKTEPQKPVDPRDKVTPCVVAGRIAGLKDNKLQVAAGNAQVTVAVPDDVRILVEVSDLRLAQPGDKVEIVGWKYAMIPGRAVAAQVTVSTEKPLTTIPAKPNRQREPEEKDESEQKNEPEQKDESEQNDESAGRGETDADARSAALE
jgi:hypothetical protein